MRCWAAGEAGAWLAEPRHWGALGLLLDTAGCLLGARAGSMIARHGRARAGAGQVGGCLGAWAALLHCHLAAQASA
jgi:hypothetical protein